MSRMLELPEETFEALEKVAKENGTTPLGWIQSRLPDTLLSQKPKNSSKTNNQTLADLFKGRVGTIQSGGGKTLSENCGEHLTEYLIKKHKEEHI